jgi:hypothetical protein
MLRIIAVLFGIAFIFGGVAGFLPSFTSNGLLLGWFQVDSMHNMVHIVSGVLAIMSATSYRYTRLYFKLFGVLYGLLAIVGFVWGGQSMMMHINMADNFLHLGIAAAALYLGFATQKQA